jgi:hypothetical protein
MGEGSFLLQDDQQQWWIFEITVPSARAGAIQAALSPLPSGTQPILVNFMEITSVSHGSTPADLARARREALPALYERGLRRLRAMAAAAGTDPGQVTRVEVSVRART